MTSAPTTPASETSWSLADCPYRGLQPYGEDDGEYYFGRDRARDLVIANLMASRLTVLYGPSGVGKSSLLRAGVIRMLTRLPATSFSYMAVGRGVVVYHTNWGQNPLTELGNSLREAVQVESNGNYMPSSGPLSLELVTEVSKQLDADVYLILDQFEEHSLYCTSADMAQLAAELERIIAEPGSRASVLIGIRDDALAQLDDLEAHLSGLFDNTLRLDHLDLESAREAIQQPLVRFNMNAPSEQQMSVEPDLVEELLVQLRTGRLSISDTGQAADQRTATIEAPFLQLVMTRLWEAERAAGSRVLRLSTLHALGNAERIVRTHLDDVMAQLTEDQRRVASEVFRYLVTPSGRKIAYTAEELAEYAGLADATPLSPVLETLSSGHERILRPVEPRADRPGEPRYEIFHDVLAAAVLDWRRRYVADRARAESEQELIAEREEAQREHELTRGRLRRTRMLSSALVLVLVAALGLGVLARANSDRAEAAAREANSAALRSESEALLSEHAVWLDRDPTHALDLAVRADSLARSPATQSAVRLALEADHERLRIVAERGYRNVVAFSPSGETFAAAGSSPTAVLHDAATGELLREFQLDDGVTATWVALSAGDPQMLALSTDDGQTTVHDTVTGQELLQVNDVAQAGWVTHDGSQMLVTARNSGPVELWMPGAEAPAGPVLTLTDEGDTSFGVFPALSIDPDGALLVTAHHAYNSDDNLISTLRVWDTESGQLTAKAGPLAGAVGSPALSGSEVVLVPFRPHGEYWRLDLWDLESGLPPDPGGFGTRVAPRVNAGGAGAGAAVIADKTVRVYRDGDLHAILPEQSEELDSARTSPDGTHLVTAGTAGEALIWRLDAGNPLAPVHRLLGHAGEIADAVFSPAQSNLVLTAGYDGTVRLWELPVSDAQSTVSSWIVGADVSRDGRQVASLSDLGMISILDVQTGDAVEIDYPYATVEDRGDFTHIRWLPDGEQVMVGTTFDWAPRIWNPVEGEIELLNGDEFSYWRGLAVNADGSLAATGDAQNRVVVWDVSAGEIMRTLEGGAGPYPIMDVKFVPEGTSVAAASVDGTVRIWDLDEERDPQELGEPGGPPVVGISVSPDGELLATVAVNRVVTLYRLGAGVEAENEQGEHVRAVPRMATFVGPAEGLGELVFSAEADLLYGAAGDGTVHVWELAGDEVHLRTVLHRHESLVSALALLPDGRIVTASHDGTTLISECRTCGDYDELLREAQARLTAREDGAMLPLRDIADSNEVAGDPVRDRDAGRTPIASG